MIRGVVRAVAAALIAVSTVAVAGCGPWRTDDTLPPRTLPADFVGVLDGVYREFDRLAADGVTAVDPATARLVGPTYGVAFDALGTARSLDGVLFHTAYLGLLPEDVSRRHRGRQRAADGHEFLLARVTADDLPPPERGYGPGSRLFTGWVVKVGDDVRPLTADGEPAAILAGAVLLVSVPAGGDALLGATVNGRTTWLSLRTGRPATP